MRPTNNFGAWDEVEGGVLGVDAATQAARVTNGGISYTIFPCSGAPNAECIRIDRLSVELTEAGSGLVMHLSMLDDSELMPITDQGHFDVPPGSLRFRVRYERAEHQAVLSTRNTGAVRGSIDTRARTIRVEELHLASDQGEPVVTSTLEARLTNIQPKARIVESRDARSGRSVFTAESFDADGDPLVHHWTIPGVGSWRGNAISPPTAPGRYAVILYADDEHRSRGVAARWLEVRPSGVP